MIFQSPGNHKGMKQLSGTLAFRFTLAVLLSLGIGGCASKGPQNSASNIFGQSGYEKLIERQQASMPEELNPKKIPKMTEADFELLGDKYFEEGKLELAFLQYSKVIEAKRDSANALYKRGLIYLKKEMNEPAVSEFKAILSKDPSNALGHQGMGQVLYKMRDYQKAQNHFQQAVKTDSKLWVSHTFLGILYNYQQQPANAIEHYNAAIALKPNQAILYNNLGISYSLMGDYDKAVECFSRELQLNPKDGKTGNNLGMVLSKLGRHHEAMEAFKIGGDEAQAFNNLGSFYLQEGNYAKAIGAFERAIELRSSYYPQANENLKKAEASLQVQTRSSSLESRKPSSRPAGKVRKRKALPPDIREMTLETPIEEAKQPADAKDDAPNN